MKALVASWGTVCCLLVGLASAQDQEKPKTLDDELKALLAETLRSPERSDELWRAVSLKFGTIDPVVNALNDRGTDASVAPGEKVAAHRLLVDFLRRRGDLRRALTILERIPKALETTDDILALAEIQDALAKDEALATYDRLLTRDLAEEVRNMVLLRRALMAKGPQEGAKSAPSPLATFASAEGRSPVLKQQAAVALALRNEQKVAIDIFQPAGEGTHRFRDEVRLADWAIEAGLWKRAQEFAWAAVRSAVMSRDKRYALTILVEAYRRDKALPRLIEELSKAEELSDDGRQVWIDLLRETGQVDEALRLFREAAEGRFTVDMRRQLLEMCRETGRESVLISAYRDLIQKEPRFLEWREGLSRFYLERGDRANALTTWSNYLEVTDDVSYRMAAAASAMNLGLDEKAEEFARASARDAKSAQAGLLFLFELHLDRGRSDEATKILEELLAAAPPDASVRADAADAFVRLGNKQRAVRLLEDLCAARKGSENPDVEMRLALLLSEVNDEDKALDRWVSLWRRVESIPRRRYVEERIMTVAARLGSLARVAVDLEKRLAEGTADDLDAGLLVRIYTRVNDPVSATEIIEEHMKTAKKKPAEMLAEKSRVFLSCHDYYNYEATIRELIEVDPEGRGDYLRQLAMSNLERGQRESARNILVQLKAEEADTSSDEFEAGVLSLAGMREEAILSYTRALARNPDAVDTYLLLSNVQKELNLHDRSAGMFQHLAKTAKRDDLFTIAIDGILNMRDGRGNRGAPNELVEWARRITMERLARRPDQLYLYQLVADLSQEIKDEGMAVRALKSALPSAGERRTPLLRELMAMTQSKGRRGGAMAIVIRNGQRVMPQVQIDQDHLMFGRRLLGQGELVPPQVYLDLGQAFLASREVVNASKTYRLMSELPEFNELQPRIAASFEGARYPKEALAIYERILTAQPTDVTLLTKVAQLQEQVGRDDIARELYERAMDRLLAARPKTTTVKKEDTSPASPGIMYYGGGNVDVFTTHYHQVLEGILATSEEDEHLDRHLTRQKEALEKDLEDCVRENAAQATLGSHPRLLDTVNYVRRLSIAFDRLAFADGLETRIVDAFPNDPKILEDFVRARLTFGFAGSARRLIEASSRPETEKRRLLLIAGSGQHDVKSGRVSISEAATSLLPLLAQGDKKQSLLMLQRLDLSTGSKEDLEHLPLLVSAASFVDDRETVLSLCRHWLTTQARHATGASLYGPLQMLLTQAHRSLDTKRYLSFVEHMVTTVVENPEKFTVFIQRLPELQKIVGTDFVTVEQLESLIKSRLSSSDRMAHGIPRLFGLIPESMRASVLRNIWIKIQKSARANFLVEVLPHLGKSLEPSFVDFLISSFKASLADIEDEQMLGYYTDALADAEDVNATAALGMIDHLLARNSKDPRYLSARAVILHRMGKSEEGLKLVRDAFGPLALAGQEDYELTEALYRVVRAFGKDHQQALLGFVDEIQKKDPKDPKPMLAKLQMLAINDDPAGRLALLREAVLAHPTDPKFRAQLIATLRGEGNLAESLEHLEQQLEQEPKNANFRAQLVSTLLASRNARRALELKKAGEVLKEEKSEEPLEATKKDPMVPANLPEIKKLVEEKKNSEARVLLRRLWRSLERYSNAAMSGMHVIYAQGFGGGRWAWPQDPKKPDPDKPKPKRHRGGLPKFIDEPPPKRTPRVVIEKTAQDVLVTHEFGERELRRQLRTMDAQVLDQSLATDIYRALASQEATREDRESIIGRLLARDKEGTAGKALYGFLFAHLEASASVSTDETFDATLERLLERLNFRDTGELLRMARLYAKTGRRERATTLYRWCAAASPTSAGSRGFNLIEEVVEHLEGDQRNEVIEALLEMGRPPTNNVWAQDGFERNVVATWDRLLGPELALEKVRPICNTITNLGDMPRRETAKSLVPLLARAGEIETALKALEVGICRLPVPPSLSYPWFRDNFTTPRPISTHDLARFFPKDSSGWRDYPAWLSGASERVLAWQAEDRLHETTCFEILCVLAIRLHEAQDPKKALQVLNAARTQADKKKQDMLWIADVLERLGRPKDARAIERDLLQKKRLHVERIPSLVEFIRANEGPSAALAVGEDLVGWTLHPELLEVLVRAADEALLPDKAKHWAQMKTETESAEAEFQKSENAPRVMPMMDGF